MFHLQLTEIHLRSLGLSQSAVAIVLVTVPVCGAIFQPYCGSWSDRCELSWGKRRPFILLGTLALSLSLLALAGAVEITQLVLSSVLLLSRDNFRAVQVIFGILLVFIMFVAIQSIQVGQRALIVDSCTPSQQFEASTWAGRPTNLSGTLGYLAAFFNLTEHLEQVRHNTFLKTVVPTVVYLSIPIIMVIFCSPNDARTPPGSKNKTMGDFDKARHLISGKFNNIRTIFVVQFLSWLGWFPFLCYTVPYDDSLSKSACRYEALSMTLTDSLQGNLGWP